MFKRRRGSNDNVEVHKQSGELVPSVQEIDTEESHEAPTYGAISGMSGEGSSELPGTLGVAELEGNERKFKRFVVDALGG